MIKKKQTTKTDNKNKKLFNFKVGSDPEFTLMFREERVAADFIERIMFGSTNINTPGGELGVDGCSSTGEIRPNPSKDPEEATNNIGECLKKLAETLPIGFDMTTLSMLAAIGGHIHLNIPASYSNLEKYKKLMPVLCFPIFMSENNISSSMRLSRSYGAMADSRMEKNRVEDGIKLLDFELRGLSAEWITSRKICKAVLCYVETIHEELINNPNIFITAKNLIIKNSHEEGLLSSIYLTKNRLFVPIVMNQISKMVKKFKRYKDFKEEIDFILDYKKVQSEKKKYEFSIFNGWNFKHSKNLTKEQYNSLSGLINIACNSDANMDNFQTELSNKIIREGWNENQYMIYGIKKDVTDKFLCFEYNRGLIQILDVEGFVSAVENKEKLDLCLTSAKKMGERFENNCEKDYKHIWNKDRTKLKSTEKKRIIIGIPRDIREKNQTEILIRLIKSIEEGRTSPLKIPNTPETNTTATPCAE